MNWKWPITVLTASLMLAACSSSGGTKGTKGTNAPKGGSSSASGPDASKQPASKVKAVTMTGACAPFGRFGKYPGKKVSIYTSITDPELPLHIKVLKQFETCTGIKVQFQGDREFESALKTKVQGGNSPDIAFFPQPGLLQTFATAGTLKPASDAVTKEAAANWTKGWIGYGTVGGYYFGAPLSANLKSLVWYSPKFFKKYGYTIPTTWDEMIKLSDKMVTDGHKPWCIGIESGTATGWTLTDWMEEVMLRLYGPTVYDQWVAHKIPFNDPKVAAVLDMVGKIVKNPKYVNAGIGDVKSIATTSFSKAGLPVETGKCMLHRQANFYAANWDKGYKIAKDGDLFAFYDPVISNKFGKPIVGGGEFLGAFSDRPEVEALQLYYASADWATAKLKLNASSGVSGWASANQKADKSVIKDPIDALTVQLVTDPGSTFRFDGSDLMPASVGSGSEWKEMTQWILGESTKDALTKIEGTWPK